MKCSLTTHIILRIHHHLSRLRQSKWPQFGASCTRCCCVWSILQEHSPYFLFITHIICRLIYILLIILIYAVSSFLVIRMVTNRGSLITIATVQNGQDAAVFCRIAIATLLSGVNFGGAIFTDICLSLFW